MKMSKKVREYKSGDFIFAKVKGYPAWPARVQRLNGKKYFVYFYGTGETANLPPNMIFDYAENKDKFLTKSVKRRDFNDGVKQIEYDFANNVPLEQVIGSAAPEATEAANDTVNESANETVDESVADTTAADETIDEPSTQNDTGIEDSDETGALVIDEGKGTEKVQKGRKSTAKTPAKETPKPKEPKTPRGRPKKDDGEEVKDDEKKEDEIVSRSGRKIRPKRYIDEHTEENTTLPSPAPKKRRGASPNADKEKDKTDTAKEKDKTEKNNIKHFNAVSQAELEDLKEPFTPEDAEKENIIIAYLSSGQYIGIKLFQSRPNSFKNDNTRLQWDRQAASNALTLKMQLERGQITAQSVLAQLVMDLNLTDEEKATLDKERETEEKKSRVQFLKTEMKLIELDAKIKTCLCLEKADTELCLKLLDELVELDLKPLMLLKHPACVETVKRMRAYVGNTPSWDLSERAVLQFGQHAHRIRRQADLLYNTMKELFTTPDGLSFWEFFSERVAQFKKVTSKLTSDELLELVHEPLEMSVPTSHTMKGSVEAANEEEQQEDETAKKAKSTPAKTKKANNTTPKPSLKRQSSRKLEEKEKEKDKVKEQEKEKEQSTEDPVETNNKPEQTNEEETNTETKDTTKDKTESKDSESTSDKEVRDKEKEKDKEKKNNKDSPEKEVMETDKPLVKPEEPESIKNSKDVSDEEKTDTSKAKKESVETDKEDKADKNDKEDKNEKNDKEAKEKIEDEPRAKRTRESKKTDPPPRSPTKRKSKF